MKPYSKQLEEWANQWYEYTFNDPSASHNVEMKPLKRIISSLKRKAQ